MQDPISFRTQTGIHHIAEGLSLEWLYEGKVNLITLLDSSTSAVDEYLEVNCQIIRNWPKQEPYLTIQDVSSPKISVTPYFRKQAALIWQAAKESKIRGTNIVALQENYSISSIMRFLGNANSRFFPSNVKLIYELGREDALQKMERILKDLR